MWAYWVANWASKNIYSQIETLRLNVLKYIYFWYILQNILILNCTKRRHSVILLVSMQTPQTTYQAGLNKLKILSHMSEEDSWVP